MILMTQKLVQLYNEPNQFHYCFIRCEFHRTVGKVRKKQTMSKLNSCPRTTEQKKKYCLLNRTKQILLMAQENMEYGTCVWQFVRVWPEFSEKCNKSISIPSTSQLAVHCSRLAIRSNFISFFVNIKLNDILSTGNCFFHFIIWWTLDLLLFSMGLFCREKLLFDSFNAIGCENFDPLGTMPGLLLLAEKWMKYISRMIEWPIYFYLFKWNFSQWIIIHSNQKPCHSFIIFSYTHCFIRFIEFIASKCNIHKSSIQNCAKIDLKCKANPKNIRLKYLGIHLNQKKKKNKNQQIRRAVCR